MIVVTGGTGHIGNVLVRKLVETGQHVRVIVPPQEDDRSLRGLNIELVHGDVRDALSLVEAFRGAKVVYHLAGIVSIMSGYADVFQQVNVIGTQNVLEACFIAGVDRLVYTSSVHAFVELPHGQVAGEDTEINAEKVIGDYAKSKASATCLVRQAIQRGLDAVIVHPSGVIGPYEFKLSNTGRLISRFLAGRTVFYINGGYDFVDVRDVADGLIQACAKGRKGENYILSGEWIGVKELLRLLQEITADTTRQCKVPIWGAKMIAPFTDLYARFRKTEPLLTSYSIYTLQSNSLFSHEKATRELGYSPRPLKETLADTVHWLQND